VRDGVCDGSVLLALDQVGESIRKYRPHDGGHWTDYYHSNMVDPVKYRFYFLALNYGLARFLESTYYHLTMELIRSNSQQLRQAIFKVKIPKYELVEMLLRNGWDVQDAQAALEQYGSKHIAARYSPLITIYQQYRGNAGLASIPQSSQEEPKTRHGTTSHTRTYSPPNDTHTEVFDGDSPDIDDLRANVRPPTPIPRPLHQTAFLGLRGQSPGTFRSPPNMTEVSTVLQIDAANPGSQRQSTTPTEFEFQYLQDSSQIPGPFGYTPKQPDMTIKATKENANTPLQRAAKAQKHKASIISRIGATFYKHLKRRTRTGR
jgi:hypothetical protein